MDWGYWGSRWFKSYSQWFSLILEHWSSKIGDVIIICTGNLFANAVGPSVQPLDVNAPKWKCREGNPCSVTLLKSPKKWGIGHFNPSFTTNIHVHVNVYYIFVYYVLRAMKGIFSRQCLWSVGVSSFTYQKWGTLCKISMFQYPMKRVPKNHHARHRTTTLNHHEKFRRQSGWWYSYPSEKYIRSSVGMMTFPTVSGKPFKIPWFQSPPTTNHRQSSPTGLQWDDLVKTPGVRATRKPVHPGWQQPGDWKVRDP